jgi:hypothetical protein
VIAVSEEESRGVIVDSEEESRGVIAGSEEESRGVIARSENESSPVLEVPSQKSESKKRLRSGRMIADSEEESKKPKIPSQKAEGRKRTLRSGRVIVDSEDESKTLELPSKKTDESKRTLRSGRVMMADSGNETTPPSSKRPSKKMKSAKKAFESDRVNNGSGSELGDGNASDEPADGTMISPISDAKTPAKEAGSKDDIVPPLITPSEPRQTRRSAAAVASDKIKRSYEALREYLADAAKVLKKARKELDAAALSSEGGEAEADRTSDEALMLESLKTPSSLGQASARITRSKGKGLVGSASADAEKANIAEPRDSDYEGDATDQSDGDSDIDWAAEYTPQRLTFRKAGSNNKRLH